MWIVGLTGSMGAGKSTISSHFRGCGVPVLCADTEIHKILSEEPGVQDEIKTLWPSAVLKGSINRRVLGELVLSSSDHLSQLETLLYPYLARVQHSFLEKHSQNQTPVVVLDVPLLFEVGLDRFCHYVVVAEAPFLLRLCRVLQRPGMSLRKLKQFESHQFSGKKRRKRADFIVPTGRGRRNSLEKVEDILFFLSQKKSPVWDGRWPQTLQREVYDSRNCS